MKKQFLFLWLLICQSYVFSSCLFSLATLQKLLSSRAEHVESLLDEVKEKDTSHFLQITKNSP